LNPFVKERADKMKWREAVSHSPPCVESSDKQNARKECISGRVHLSTCAPERMALRRVGIRSRLRRKPKASQRNSHVQESGQGGEEITQQLREEVHKLREERERIQEILHASGQRGASAAAGEELEAMRADLENTKAMLASAQEESAKHRQRAERAEAELAQLRLQNGQLRVHAPAVEEGSDDVYHVAKLQELLLSAGFGVDDDELEEVFFGPNTSEALKTFQACAGLSETGCADEPTWAALVGPNDIRLDGSLAPPAPADESETNPSESHNRTDESTLGGMLGLGGGLSAIAAAAESASPSSEKSESNEGSSCVMSEALQLAGASESFPLEQAVRKLGFPELAAGETRREVRGILRALERVGFASSDEEAELSELGESAQEALRFFHASCGLQESAFVSALTISYLLQREEIAQGPEALLKLAEEKEHELGLDPEAESKGNASTQGVYLLAEGRYERHMDGGTQNTN
jgi:hypothetical protein